jgi:hypothetical protein
VTRDKRQWDVDLTPARPAARRSAGPPESVPPSRDPRQDQIARSIAELMNLVRRVDARIGELEARFVTLTGAVEAVANGSSSNGHVPSDDASADEVADSPRSGTSGARIANLRSPSAEISRASARIQDASASGGRRVAATKARSRPSRARIAE